MSMRLEWTSEARSYLLTPCLEFGHGSCKHLFMQHMDLPILWTRQMKLEKCHSLLSQNRAEDFFESWHFGKAKV